MEASEQDALLKFFISVVVDLIINIKIACQDTAGKGIAISAPA
jgi:hypothetical protein